MGVLGRPGALPDRGTWGQSAQYDNTAHGTRDRGIHPDQHQPPGAQHFGPGGPWLPLLYNVHTHWATRPWTGLIHGALDGMGWDG